MPKRKPAGWPKYMVAKRLATGVAAYYWAAPTWARKGKAAGEAFSVSSVPLGKVYGDAKVRCDDILNPQFEAWRRGGDVVEATRRGTFDWLVSVYKRSPRYTKLPEGTRKDYDRALHDVSSLPMKDGRLIGVMAIESITPGVADKLFERLRLKADGTPRTRSAVLSMVVCKLAWTAARRSEPKTIAEDNPFANMKLSYAAASTRPVTHDELVRFVEAADKAAEPSLGTAAMIAFYWLQRQVDILSRVAWSHYRPNGASIVKVRHHKTGVDIDLPLYDEDGSALWPEIMERLDAAPRHGSLIVMRDQLDRRRKIHMPWKEDYFRHRVADIRTAAKIDPEVKFMGLRHGGNTEGADADLTDAQLRALSGHKSTALLRYVRETDKQRVEAARKRRDARTKKEHLSE